MNFNSTKCTHTYTHTIKEFFMNEIRFYYRYRYFTRGPVAFTVILNIPLFVLLFSWNYNGNGIESSDAFKL